MNTFRFIANHPLTRDRKINLNGRRSSSGNTLYLRNPEAIQAEVSQSPAYRVIGVEL